MATNERAFELGDPVEDRLTGFRGVITGLVYYMTGCNQALVVPRVQPDGRMPEGAWLDLQRLMWDKRGKRIVLERQSVDSPGGDLPPPRRF